MSKYSKMKKQILYIFMIIVIIFICILTVNPSNNKPQCEFSFYRFEQDFFNIPIDSFDSHFLELQVNYPSFFHDTTIDFKNDVFLNDTLNAIYDSVQLVFKSRFPKLLEMQQGYCNYKNYFPYDSLSFYSYIEGAFDYRYPVVFANNNLYISLELFLGSSHSFYNAFPDYIKFSSLFNLSN